MNFTGTILQILSTKTKKNAFLGEICLGTLAPPV